MTDVRTPLAQLPTPLEYAPRLSTAWGGPEIWVKRDDLTGFELSGNKVRKLEFHLGAAQAAGATALVTCGAVQSNHCRATAIVAARLGMRCVLLLRSASGDGPHTPQGNHLLQRLAGAEIHFVTPDQYGDRTVHMAAVAAGLEAAGEVPWIIPEGASDRLGMIAFDHALGELAQQLDANGGPVRGKTVLWHASSSAGTTAGLALGVATRGLAIEVVGSSVGDSADFLSRRVRSLLAEGGEGAIAAAFEIVDDYIGEGYGRTTAEELAVQVEATRLTGLIWDPTYTGKAMYALKREIERGRFEAEDRVVFWHTGGGFAVFAHNFAAVLD
jgi:D-cysteine desulfhydrase